MPRLDVYRTRWPCVDDSAYRYLSDGSIVMEVAAGLLAETDFVNCVCLALKSRHIWQSNVDTKCLKKSMKNVSLRVCWDCCVAAAATAVAATAAVGVGVANDDDVGNDCDWLFPNCTGSWFWICWFCGITGTCGGGCCCCCCWDVKSSCELTCGDIISTCSLFVWFCFDNFFCESRKFCFVSVGLLFVTVTTGERERERHTSQPLEF